MKAKKKRGKYYITWYYACGMDGAPFGKNDTYDIDGPYVTIAAAEKAAFELVKDAYDVRATKKPLKGLDNAPISYGVIKFEKNLTFYIERSQV